MKALCFKEFGSLENMAILEVPRPQAGYGEVLVEIKASAFNHLDIWVRKGWPGLKLALPHISGSDGAGIIKELGAGVKSVNIGDRVAINPGINLYEDEFTWQGEHSVSPGYKILGEDLPGTHAEFIAVPTKNLVRIPENLSFTEAAAIGLVGITAWRMLFKRAELKARESVLILGAGGGVNSLCVQLAKLAGCIVYATTSSEDKLKKVKALGADHVVNYKTDSNWDKTILELTNFKGVDVVVDNIGSATIAKSMRVVKRGGRIVIIGNTSGPQCEIDTRYIFGKQISLIGSTMGNQDDYLQIMNLVFAGLIKPVVEKTFDLQDGAEAMRLLESGEQFGKIVLTR